MQRFTPIATVLFLGSIGLVGCGSSSPDTQNPGGTGGAGATGGVGATGGAGATGGVGAPGGNGGSTSNPGSTGVKANGLFEIHYIGETPTAPAHTDISGFMYDGAQAPLVIWDKKQTEGDCSLYTPRTPFCESCGADQVCVDTNTCRTPPSTQDVGAVSMTGLNPPSGANPLGLTAVSNATGTTYLCAETLPVPPCTAGGAVSMAATGKGDYPAFSVQTQCIPSLAVANTSVAIESGKAFALAWTPSNVTGARLQLTFDLSHHGGSKGKIICDTADSGSLSVSGTLIQKLMALGVTGYPKAYVNRLSTGTTAVGSGQAQLKLYSDVDFVVQIPGLVSCETDADCATAAGETCQVPGQMCGISCTINSQCPSGKTCLSTTKICG
jgi:hypothetical protein